MKWTVILTKETDPDPQFANTYCAECLELPGCVTQGEGMEETVENMKEAIRCHLTGLIKHSQPIPDGFPPLDLSGLEDPPDFILALEVEVPQVIAA